MHVYVYCDVHMTYIIRIFIYIQYTLIFNVHRRTYILRVVRLTKEHLTYLLRKDMNSGMYILLQFGKSKPLALLEGWGWTRFLIQSIDYQFKFTLDGFVSLHLK